jgi:PAS domain S-box-containing protein
MKSGEIVDPLFFAFALDKMDEAVALVDENAQILYVNQKASEILGHSPEDCLSLHIFDIDPNFPAPRWPDHWHELRQAKSLHFESTIFTKKEQLIPIEISASFYLYKEVELELVIFRDISEQKEALTKLNSINNYLSAMFETTRDPLAVIDLHGRISDVNMAMEKVLGETHNNLIGSDFSKYFLDPREANKRFAEILANGYLESQLVYLKGKNNTNTPLQINANTMVDQAGQVNGIFISGKDISERLEFEKELQKQNERYHNAQSIGHVGNWEYNVQTNDFWGSDEAKMIYGLDPKDANFSTEQIESCIPERQRVHQALIDLIQLNKPYELEFEIQPKDGSDPRFIKSYAKVHKDATGQPILVTGALIDITELKKSEQNLLLLNAAAEAAGNGIVITDKEGNITYANPAFCELTGYKVEEVIGKNPRLIRSGVQDTAYYESLWTTISSGKRWRGELINKRADGTLYHEEMTISPVINNSGEIVNYIAVKQNIDGRKQQENEREIIFSITNGLRTASSRFDTIHTFIRQIESIFTAEAVLFISYDPNLNETWIEQGCGPIGDRLAGSQIPIDQEVSNQVLQSGKTYLCNDVRSDPNFFRVDTLRDASAAMCLPLLTQDQIIGAVWMIRKKDISQSEVQLLTTLCALAANSIQRVTLFEKTQRQYKQMVSIHQVDQAISSVLNLNIILDILLRNAISQLGVDAASLLLFDPISRTLKFAAGTGFTTDEVAKTKLKLGEGRAGKAAAERRVITDPNLSQSKDGFSRVILYQKEEFLSHHIAPLIDKGEVCGVLEVFSKTRLIPGDEWLELFGILATQAAIAVDNLTLFNELQKRNSELSFAYDATIKGWSEAMDMRDRYSEDHTQRVVDASLRLAQAMGIAGADLVNIRRGALLHDVGKISVPDSILQKTGKLSPAEKKVLEKHPLLAYEMLRPISYLKNAIEIPYCHHEKWDGSGYPRHLKEEEIPLSARIFAVVNTWDALTNDRPYRKALSTQAAINEMQSESGKAFDPHVLDVFLSNKIYEQTD